MWLSTHSPHRLKGLKWIYLWSSRQKGIAFFVFSSVVGCGNDHKSFPFYVYSCYVTLQQLQSKGEICFSPLESVLTKQPPVSDEMWASPLQTEASKMLYTGLPSLLLILETLKLPPCGQALDGLMGDERHVDQVLWSPLAVIPASKDKARL